MILRDWAGVGGRYRMPSGKRESNSKVALAWQAITLKVPYGVSLANTVMVQQAVTNSTV